MGRFQLIVAAALAFAAKNAAAFTIGTPAGLAAGTTGGGNGTVVYPTSTTELIQYLNSTEPLVVVLNQTFDFRGTEGTTTEPGCRPDYTRKCMALNNGFKSQDVIIQGGNMATTGGCTNGTNVTVTYDNAPLKRINIKSDKTLRGIGRSGVIIGKGLTLAGNNIIVQNVHITELNHHLVWGGDAIYMQGLDHGKTPMNNIWLDHIKVSRVGRQFLTTNLASTPTMTISNSDFDGETDYSATCDGRHYWTFIFYGTTRFSMLNNYVHSTSGRSPKIGGNNEANVVAHIANNFWGNNSGHSFEIGVNAWILAEGNHFSNTRLPLLDAKYGSLYAPNATDDECPKYLGRSCAVNGLENSGNFTSRDGLTALETVKNYPAMKDYSSGSTSSSTAEQQTTGSTAQWTQISQNTPGSAVPSTESIQSSDLEKVWSETTANFGVGKLD